MRKRMFSDEVRLPKPKINPKNVMTSGSLVAAHRPHPTTTWKRLFFHVPCARNPFATQHATFCGVKDCVLVNARWRTTRGFVGYPIDEKKGATEIVHLKNEARYVGR